MEQIKGMKESVGVEEQENDLVGRELQRSISLFLFLLNLKSLPEKDEADLEFKRF